MLEIISHMTEAEKKATVQQIDDYNKNLKVDEEATDTAFYKYRTSPSDAIHFNLMKCDILTKAKLPIIPLTPEDYRDICEEPTEEKSREKLCQVLATRIKEYKKMEQEPKMDIIAEADNNPRNQKLDCDRLRSYIERIERLESEKEGIASDIREIYAEAKSTGYDAKAMRAVIRLRKMNQADRDEQEFLLDEYKKMLGI